MSELRGYPSDRKADFGGSSARFINNPSAYDYVYDQDNDRKPTKPGVLTWLKRRWWIPVVVAVVVIVVGVVVGVEEVQANKYPDYSKLTYTLADTYAGTTFFDNFEYFATYDPADGLVHYADESASAALNLTYATADSAIMKVDTRSDVDATTGRISVRLVSNTQYNNGLFIFDVVHTPFQCSTWPALWLSDPSNWPTNGEIDVMEAVNTATTGNQMTLHTTNGCSMKAKRKETGSVLTTNCYNGTDDNAGCGVTGKSASFGSDFNNNGGGIYAMEWRSAGIRIWFFDRSSIPSDITTSTSNSTPTAVPDPSTWPEPLADFPSTHCDIDTHFSNHSIIADIDFCGPWAEQTKYYNTIAGCPGTCAEYVAGNSSNFVDAYWEFRSWRVWTAES